MREQVFGQGGRLAPDAQKRSGNFCVRDVVRSWDFLDIKFRKLTSLSDTLTYLTD